MIDSSATRIASLIGLPWCSTAVCEMKPPPPAPWILEPQGLSGFWLGLGFLFSLFQAGTFANLVWLACQTHGFTGSALGVVCPVSIYCGWVRQKVRFATSVSVWQHLQLYEQICPWHTLACCWDVKQPTSNNVTDLLLRS